MANRNNSKIVPSSQQKTKTVDADQTTASMAPNSKAIPSSFHQEFSWRLPEAKSTPHSEFIELARNISRGAELCLQIVVMDGIDRDTEMPTLLSAGDLDRLVMMTSSALRMLGDYAEEAIEGINDTATRGAA